MKYNKIKKAKFINRPNRFIANVLIDNKIEKVHVRNTGRCKELLIPNATVILEDCIENLNRKTRYSIIGVYKDNKLINMDSQIPNNVIETALKCDLIKEIKNPTNIKREITYKNSRFDFFFKEDDIDTFLEVKGVTLEENNIAKFPDAPTKRGTKHIYEMINAVENGFGGIIFFLIQMKGPQIFKPYWKRDKDFSKALNLAHKKGVKIIVYDSIVTESTIKIGNSINIDLKE